MRQVYRVLCTYSADLFGICSAFYELGGLCVMHDASGCNSTYNTHDEPRWYEMDSMVYVSGLCEKDAILGNDQKLIDDICEVACSEHPKFIAISGSVLPMFMGTDFHGIARVVEKRTGIPTFGFMTTGIKSYVVGAGAAFKELAKRFCTENVPSVENGINLLGVTPIDFYSQENVNAMEKSFTDAGFSTVSCWAMGNTLEQLSLAAGAKANVVVSASGLPAAEYMKKKFGIPYVIGIPMGESAILKMNELIRTAIETKESFILQESAALHKNKRSENVWIVDEAVFASSLRFCLKNDFSFENVHILCPLEENCGLLRKDDSNCTEEQEIERILNQADILIADPIYRRILSGGRQVRFIDFPHIGYSGRFYQEQIPMFTEKGFTEWLRKQLL